MCVADSLHPSRARSYRGMSALCYVLQESLMCFARIDYDPGMCRAASDRPLGTLLCYSWLLLLVSTEHASSLCFQPSVWRDQTVCLLLVITADLTSLHRR